MFVPDTASRAGAARAPAAAAVPAADAPPWQYTVSVLGLCEFTAKQGDLDRRFTPSATALEGQLGELAVAARRGPAYQRQLALAGVFQGLRVRGRADGFDPESHSLEEIKTIRGAVEAIPGNRRRLHWAQLQTYGALFCRERGLAEVRLRLVYVDIASQAETVLDELCAAAALEAAFVERCGSFLAWARQEAAHRRLRDAGLGELAFPLPAFRRGQRPLAEAVYRAAVGARVLLAQAPTGIGKTIGVLYPMLRAMPGQRLDKVAYLTCKTSGRIAALEALQSIRQRTPGRALRVLALVAREQACEHPDKACHGDACPLARGFYDRLPAARAEAAATGWLDPAAQRTIALRHRICPYYLGQEMLRWADVVVADVHHAFDHRGQLHGLTQALDWRVGLLVDEAHNLVDRTRQMYGATLTLAQIRAALPAVPPAARAACASLLRSAAELAAGSGAYAAYDEAPKALGDALAALNAALGEHFQAQPLATGPLLAFYFDALQLQWALDRLGPHAFFDVAGAGDDAAPVEAVAAAAGVQASLLADDGEVDAADATLCVRNVIPGEFIRRRWQAFHTATLFSATLGSESYQRDLLGLPETAQWLDIASPFDPGHLCVQVAHRLSTRYPHRTRSLHGVVDLMARQLAAHPGNYLAFFSSFAYLDQAAACLARRWPDVPQWRQSRTMGETARHAFLQRFEPAGSGIGFAVLGGAFAEGVDLPGRRLIGAFVATLGLPPVSPVNDQMRARLDAQFGSGHGYAGLVPGLQKVVQAAGRVIRAPDDRGWVWLMDDRYLTPGVTALLPASWRVGRATGASG